MSQPAAMLLGLARAPVALGSVPPAAVELAGRGYVRAPTGPLANPGVDPAEWRNTLPILWPQAPVDWGEAPYLMLLRASDGVVLASVPATPGYAILAGDQPRIAPLGLYVRGVGANTPRPFGRGRYSESTYGNYPAAGGIFFAAASTGFEWARADDACAAWTGMAPIVAGGCAA